MKFYHDLLTLKIYDGSNFLQSFADLLGIGIDKVLIVVFKF